MKVGLNLLLILSIIAVVLTGCNTDPHPNAAVIVQEQRQEAANQQSPQPQTKKVESFNTEEIVAVKQFIVSVINAKAEEKTVLREDKRIRNIEIKDKSVTVELLADISFSTELVKSIILNKSTEIYKEAFRERNDISKITLDWQYPETDAKGNEKITPFISLTLSSDNEKTFNWDKVIFTRLPEAVDTYKEYFKN